MVAIPRVLAIPRHIAKTLTSFREKVLREIPEDSKDGSIAIVMTDRDHHGNVALHNLFLRASEKPSEGFESTDVEVGELQPEPRRESFVVKYADTKSLAGLHQTCVDRAMSGRLKKNIHSMGAHKPEVEHKR